MADKPLALDAYVVPEDDLSKYVLEPLGMQTKRPDERTAYQRLAQGATESVGQQGGPLAKVLATAIIPQNEAELGMAIGTAGANAAASRLGLTGAKGAVLRTVGGAIGGEAGGEYGGLPPGAGGVTGAASGVVGEAVPRIGGWIARSVGGMPGRINRQRSATVGKIIEDRVPALAGARDPQQLSDIARDFEMGKGALFDYYQGLRNRFSQSMGGRRVKIPELVDPADAATAASIRQQIAANQGQYTPQHVAAMQAQADRLESVPIETVWDELKNIGYSGYGGAKSDPNTRTIVGSPSRIGYDDLINKAEAELQRLDPSGALAQQFKKDRSTAAAGFTFIKMLQGKNAFRRGSETQLNIPFLQEFVDKNQTEIQRKIGPDAWAKLKEVLWPGGAHPSLRDIPGPYMPGSTDVAMEALRGTGGSPRIFSLIPRLIAPGIGSQYAGRAPFTPSGGLLTLMDILTQRGLAPFTRPGGGTP